MEDLCRNINVGSVVSISVKHIYKLGKRPSPRVPASWRPIQGYHRPPAETEPILGKPYGDNPVDSKWIEARFRYYEEHKKK